MSTYTIVKRIGFYTWCKRTMHIVLRIGMKKGWEDLLMLIWEILLNELMVRYLWLRGPLQLSKA